MVARMFDIGTIQSEPHWRQIAAWRLPNWALEGECAPLKWVEGLLFPTCVWACNWRELTN